MPRWKGVHTADKRYLLTVVLSWCQPAGTDGSTYWRCFPRLSGPVPTWTCVSLVNFPWLHLFTALFLTLPWYFSLASMFILSIAVWWLQLAWNSELQRTNGLVLCVYLACNYLFSSTVMSVAERSRHCRRSRQCKLLDKVAVNGLHPLVSVRVWLRREDKLVCLVLHLQKKRLSRLM